MAVDPVPITVDDTGATVNVEDAMAFFAYFGTAAAGSPTDEDVPKTLTTEADAETFFLGGPVVELARACTGFSRQGGVAVRLTEDDPGAYGDIDDDDFTGTVIIEADATAVPINDFEVVIEFPDGGTLGTPGITYRVALDGRDANGAVRTHIGRKRQLGAATQITVREEGSSAIAARFNLLPPAAQVTALVTLVNEERTDRLAHYALGATTHNAADATSGVGIGGAATDLDTAITLVNQIRAADLLHAANAPTVHNSADTTSYAAMPAAATDGPTAIALAIYLKTGGNTHNANAVVHDTADAANDITSANPTPGIINDGDVITCPTYAPTYDEAAITSAFEALANYTDNVYTTVVIRGAITPAMWDAIETGRALLATGQYGRPVTVIVETRLPDDGESDSAFRIAIDADYDGLEHADVYPCANYGRYDSSDIPQLKGRYRRTELVPFAARNQALDYGASTALVGPLVRSAGPKPSVFGGRLLGFRVTELGQLIGHDERFHPGLRDAGFGVLTTYAEKVPGDAYVYKAKTRAPNSNTAPDLRQRRVVVATQLAIKQEAINLVGAVPAFEPGRTTLRSDIADMIDSRINDYVRDILGARVDSFTFAVDRNATISLQDTVIPWTARVIIAGDIISLPGVLQVNKV